MSELEVLPAATKLNVENAINEIRVSWKKTTDAICETAAILFKYKGSDKWSEIEQALDQNNIIKISVQKFLIGIAQNRTLMNEEYRELLPPHYNSLYHLSRIRQDKLENLLEKGTINSGLQLGDARLLAEKFGTKSNSTPRTPVDSAKATIIMKFDKSRGAKTQALEALKLLKESFPLVDIELKSVI